MRFLPIALAALPLPAIADTYTVTSVPTAVTVYSGFAMVTREVGVDIRAGAHEVVLPDLPQWIDAGSLRVSITGADLSGTRLRTDALPPQPDNDSDAVVAAKEQIKAAERALRDLNDAAQDAGFGANAADARVKFLEGLGSSDTLPTTPQALAELGQMIDEQVVIALLAQAQAIRGVRDIEAGREALDRNLADARAALAALTPPTEPKALLALSVAAQEAGTVIASISYPARASWQPTYDVVLTRSDADSMTLRRAALIYQNSGENWDDVTLTLSTLAPSGRVVPSELYPPLLRFEDSEQSKDLQRSSLTADTAGAPMVRMEAAAAPQPNFDGPGVTYTLPAPLTIARDAEGARVELDALEFDARVFARAVPSRDTTAFLMAEGKNASLEPLLAAQSAQIFIDGALVGRSSFAAVPAGGMLTQAFGPIEGLRLSHKIIEQSEGDRGLISRSNAQTREVRMTIANLGDQEWDVELLEALPYSEQDDLVIEWNAQPRASETDVDDRRGLAQWDISLAANATQEVTVEQIVRWPDGKVLR